MTGVLLCISLLIHKGHGEPLKGYQREGTMQNKVRMVSIEETTIATIDGWRITVGNIMKGRWRLPNGTEREGISAEVGIYDENRVEKGEWTVGEGTVINISGKQWLVTRVNRGKGRENGSIDLMQNTEVIYTYADGSGNTYILTEQNRKMLEYIPIKAKESSSGVYDGGSPVKKQITDEQYAAILSAIEKAIQNKSIHIEQREMRSGYIKVQKDSEKSVYIIAPNTVEQFEIERVLKQALSG